MRTFVTTRWQRLMATTLRSRDPRRRRGSILIMVVAVLVLLALMGTAYMSIARLDRQAAGPANEQTTDEVIEYLLPTIAEMARDAIARDVSSTAFGYRSPSDTTYDNYDYASPTWIGTTLNPPATPNTLSLRNDAYL